MKVVVLIPSDEYKNYAGCRIRYGRLQPRLAAIGVELRLEDVAQFAPHDSDCDVLVISKCHDARATIAAAIFTDRGRRVGVDIFDDYFSQLSDARLLRFRNWLSQLLDHCQFVLCSTPALSRVVETYRKLPVHVLSDPADTIDEHRVANLLADKLRQARDAKTIRLVWFGLGDNPYFKVGLSDLAGYCAYLTSLGDDATVDLTVLTNERSLSSEGLAKIGQLPVRTSIELWSEERERELLSEAFACFLPVNAQRFSVAKSLNRAVTALGAGCQVLSVGYPLYEPLEDLIYRDPRAFLGDFAQSSMRHSPEGIGRFRERMALLADPEKIADDLVAFLEGIPLPSIKAAPALALIHGHATNGLAHKLVQLLQNLSIASPFCTAPLGFDVIFRIVGDDRLAMLLSEKAARRLSAPQRELLGPSFTIAGRKFRELAEPLPAYPLMRADGQIAGSELAPLPVEMATYAPMMDEIRSRIQSAFGPLRVIVSEESRLPFEAQSEAAS